MISGYENLARATFGCTPTDTPDQLTKRSRRHALAALLPETFALILLNPLQATEPLPPERFLRATAVWIEGATEQTAAWDVSAVLSVTADAAGEELTRRILLQLPPGYDLFFGRPSV